MTTTTTKVVVVPGFYDGHHLEDLQAGFQAVGRSKDTSIKTPL